VVWAAVHFNTRLAKFNIGPRRKDVTRVGFIPRDAGFEPLSTPKHALPNEVLMSYNWQVITLLP
jgi:hypothetical protein